MKINRYKLSLLLVCLCVTTIASAQRIYFDSSFNQTKKKKAYWYREVVQVKSGVSVVEDHYMTGELYMTGYFATENTKDLEGIWSDVLRTGYFTYYHRSGAIMMKGQYTQGQKDEQWLYYYDSSKQVKELGSYAIGNKVGEWKSYYRNGKLKQKVVYNGAETDYTYVRRYANDSTLGRIARTSIAECYNTQGSIIPCKDMEDAMPIPDVDNVTTTKHYTINSIEMPMPGYNLNEYLGSHVKYPLAAINNNSTGRVLVAVNVNMDGSLTNIRSLTPYLDASLQMEALRVISEMPNWQPIKTKLYVNYIIPIVFKIQ